MQVYYGECLSSAQPHTFKFQLRVVRAFKSTLEDLEEKLSIHSAHSLPGRPGLRHNRHLPADIAFIDADDMPPAARNRFLPPAKRSTNHQKQETPI